MGIWVHYDDLEEERENIKQYVEKLIFEEDYFFKSFFSYEFIRKIINSEIRDIAPYRNLNLFEALKKYDEKQIFKNKKPIKIYPNGYRWIDVGKDCYLLGFLMKNCGRAVARINDKDDHITMIALFDQNNNPHAVVTYSVNNNAIRDEQGKASTVINDQWHDYILDLANELNATIDQEHIKSNKFKLIYKQKTLQVK
jgi:hypothetical protein